MMRKLLAMRTRSIVAQINAIISFEGFDIALRFIFFIAIFPFL